MGIVLKKVNMWLKTINVKKIHIFLNRVAVDTKLSKKKIKYDIF